MTRFWTFELSELSVSQVTISTDTQAYNVHNEDQRIQNSLEMFAVNGSLCKTQPETIATKGKSQGYQEYSHKQPLRHACIETVAGVESTHLRTEPSQHPPL